MNGPGKESRDYGGDKEKTKLSGGPLMVEAPSLSADVGDEGAVDLRLLRSVNQWRETTVGLPIYNNIFIK